MIRHLRTFPWLSMDQAFQVARIVTAGLFLAHAIGRIMLGSIPQFGAFMENLGFPKGVAVVWAITVVEIVAGLALILGRWVRWACLALFAVVFGGIVLIHAGNGWFVGEHGVGGSEYSVALIALLLLIAAHDRHRGGKSGV